MEDRKGKKVYPRAKGDDGTELEDTKLPLSVSIYDGSGLALLLL